MQNICSYQTLQRTTVLDRDHYVYAPNQWETTLQCNVVSHWLGAYTKWFLLAVHHKKCMYAHGSRALPISSSITSLMIHVIVLLTFVIGASLALGQPWMYIANKTKDNITIMPIIWFIPYWMYQDLFDSKCVLSEPKALFLASHRLAAVAVPLNMSSNKIEVFFLGIWWQKKTELSPTAEWRAMINRKPRKHLSKMFS